MSSQHPLSVEALQRPAASVSKEKTLSEQLTEIQEQISKEEIAITELFNEINKITSQHTLEYNRLGGQSTQILLEIEKLRESMSAAHISR